MVGTHPGPGGATARFWWATGVAAAAAARSGSRRQDELGHVLQAIRDIAGLLVVASDDGSRARLAQRYAHVLRRAADLATELDEPAAADLVMEAVRRDRVGLLLQNSPAAPK